MEVTGFTSTSVSLKWIPVVCIERNGELTGYLIRGGRTNEDQPSIIARTTEIYYTIMNLAPHTQYWFQAAGVNALGTGPFSDSIGPVTTAEDGMKYFLVHS